MKSRTILFCIFVFFLFITECDELTLKEQRTAVLNALYYQALSDSTTRIAEESYPYKVKHGLANWDSLRLRRIESIQKNSISDNPDSLIEAFPFTNEDIAAFNRQLDTNPQAIWSQWGWKTPHFISKEEYPDYFSKGPVLPPAEPPSRPLIEIVSVSVPLVSEDRAFVAILVKKGYSSMGVYVYLLGKVEGQWTIIGQKPAFTT